MNSELLIKEDYSLRDYNTFNLDTTAKKFIELKDDDEIEYFIQSEFLKEGILILGGGSNLLLLNDFNGIVAHLSNKGIRVLNESVEDVIVECEAGEIWDDVVSFCVENKFYGIENLALIPGTIGAAPIQNIGAYGVEIKDVLVSVEGFDLISREKRVLTVAECELDYRSSIFKTTLKGRFLISKVKLRLSRKKKFHLNYRALNEKFGKRSVDQISIEDVSSYIKKIRTEKLPDYKILGNAGSFFKNPEVSPEQLAELKKEHHDIVSFATTAGTYKLAAGWLIEECGFKGKRIGNVSCYEKQALVIVNHGGATGKEIKEYSERIQGAVKNKFGINLTPEVNII
ncbi:MAG: UDP-N-acetylmuramate dehydrogenase [Stygiobacter sp.]|nr:MAG: UDP-N-acetylenolpyruvoylglucosamine reductase [Stygiobacter sp. GWC2_38_9]OGV06078.1 MAG: UDP-N-acetylenolpyruvoylglucosamine reductase [Stygiobacter sp. RIFOXYB2_FULL_37_11]OGV10203.1 MAG: UDP-N-acetylenolpyruvoylglucosamine reductase [Stygiobacter sp. RIFOXYA2_FULL_38_8]OGV16858.1 MAG: UDP-N-acetylenolpyruvoylglucosamine reductase [Stygiobacter sp. RIFOXYC2_FULL_38_25]OGV82791.1 MAG: UDP-N-acetylenolpyruvoylglucosamine reductase [Stygiobacter sp. GWF2_38_21]RJQ57250.1 MAG: UDP-N-acet